VEIDCLCAGILFADVACAPVERVPEPGELVPTERMQLGLGGCASNTGVDLAKLGYRVGVSGCVGDDPFGKVIIEALEAGGVDARGIHRLAGTGSACSMIINVRGQDRRCQAKVIYVGGYFMMPELETEEMVELFRAARAAGTKTILDVVLYGDEPYWDRLAPLLGETDVFMPNDDEAALITGLDDPLAQAERFREAGAATVVITQGEKGSLLVSDDLRLRAGAYRVDFVGGTGSGDAFDAGFIAGMLAGEDPAGCIRWGSALGASCVKAIGATEGVFDRAEAEAFLEKHPLEIEKF